MLRIAMSNSTSPARGEVEVGSPPEYPQFKFSNAHAPAHPATPLIPASRKQVPSSEVRSLLQLVLQRTSEGKGHLRIRNFQCRFRFEVPVMNPLQTPQELQIGGAGTTRLRRP
jgi:hypothetical protein